MVKKKLSHCTRKEITAKLAMLAVLAVGTGIDGMLRSAIAQIPETVPTDFDGNEQAESQQSLTTVAGIGNQHPQVLSGNNRGTISEISQTNSVFQLTDVQPNDWAYEALRGLVERYGCITGYPDGTYGGNRALTRYEFAAGLQACLDAIARLATSGETETLNQADLATLERLQTDFAAELATLNTQVASLEERITTLEENQFSPTTKLFGFTWFNVNGAYDGGAVERETFFRGVTDFVEDPNTTLSGLVWLDFVTSFTGRDNLTLQLATGTQTGFPGPLGNFYASAGLEYFTADFTSGPGAAEPFDVTVRELYYQFPVAENLEVVVGPRFNFFRFLEGNQFSFAFTAGPPIFNYITFNSANSTLVNALDRGGGAVVFWGLNDQLLLKLAYMAETNEYLPSFPFNSISDPDQGFFGGTNTLTAELTYQPTDNANIRFLYTRTNIQAIDLRDIGIPVDQRVLCCGITEPLIGVADDGFGGSVEDGTADTFGINADWLITPRFGIFGRYTYGSTNIFPEDPALPGGEVNAQAFQLGFAFPDLGREGALGQLSFLIPYDILSGEEFLVSGAGDGGTWWEVEGSYFVPISRNIALVPSVSVVMNANNFDSNPTVVVGNLRTQFNF